MKNDSCSRSTLFKVLRLYILTPRRASTLSWRFLSICCLFTFPYQFIKSHIFSISWGQFPSVWFLFSWWIHWAFQVVQCRESTCQCRRLKRRRFDPWVGKIPWRREWLPTPVFLPGKFMNRGAWQGTVCGSQRVRHNWANNSFISSPVIHFQIVLF